jgi:hypothetical protein
MSTRPRRPRHQNRVEILTTHLIKGLPVAAVFSVALQCAIQVPKASVKGGLNGETGKVKSLSPSVRCLQMATPGPMLLSRSNRPTLSYQNKAVRTKISIQHRQSILLLLIVLGVLVQRDRVVTRDLEHPPVVCFQKTPPTQLQNNSQALPVPLIRLHIRLHSHQTE